MSFVLTRRLVPDVKEIGVRSPRSILELRVAAGIVTLVLPCDARSPRAAAAVRKTGPSGSALATRDLAHASRELLARKVSVAITAGGRRPAERALGIGLVARFSRSALGAGRPGETRLLHRGNQLLHWRVAAFDPLPRRVGRRGAKQHFAAPFARKRLESMGEERGEGEQRCEEISHGKDPRQVQTLAVSAGRLAASVDEWRRDLALPRGQQV